MMQTDGKAEPGLGHNRELLKDALLEVWRDVLMRPDLKADDDLVRFGNRSIVMLKVYLEVKTKLRIEVPLAAMFDLETVEDFVDYLCGGHKADPATTAANGGASADSPTAD
jgi:acyl carrier protein